MSEPLVIGVDAGGTKLLGGVMNRDGTIVRQREVPTKKTSEEALLSGIDDLVESLLDGDVRALGFGLPSTIDQRTGQAVWSANIPLADEPFRERYAERFSLPVGIDNDANAAAIAEWKVGAGRGTNHMIMLTLGTGVGGGLILDGRPYRGAVGAAAELGHVVVEFDGRPCGSFCKGRGHIEAYATGGAASRDAAKAFGDDADSYVLLERARAGDRVAVEVLDGIGRRLGATMGSFVNIFNPEAIVIGGGWGKAAGDFLLETAREVMEREALSPARELVRIVPAQLGPEAGLVGAGFVAFEALDDAG
ncbi:MAG: ROK family protein [Gaiellaceae bacterium]